MPSDPANHVDKSMLARFRCVGLHISTHSSSERRIGRLVPKLITCFHGMCEMRSKSNPSASSSTSVSPMTTPMIMNHIPRSRHIRAHLLYGDEGRCCSGWSKILVRRLEACLDFKRALRGMVREFVRGLTANSSMGTALPCSSRQEVPIDLITKRCSESHLLNGALSGGSDTGGGPITVDSTGLKCRTARGLGGEEWGRGVGERSGGEDCK